MSLIHWWPLNNSYADNGTGSITLIPSTDSFSSGKVTLKAYNSTADGQYLKATDLNVLNSFDEYSIACWVYITGPGTWNNTTAIISSGNYNDDSSNFIFGFGGGNAGEYYDATDGYKRILVPNNHSPGLTCYYGIDLTSENYITPNTWKHVAITYKDGVTKAYVDGNFAGSTNYGKKMPTTNVSYYYIGGATYYDGFALKGKLNDVRIYNHELSIKEVHDLAQGLCVHYAFNVEDMYQPVEYLESTGTQYINLGIRLNQDYAAEVDFNLTEATSTETDIFGADITPYPLIGTFNSKFRFRVTADFQSNSINVDTDRHKLYWSTKSIVLDDNEIVSGDAGSYSLDKDAYLFAANTNSGANYFSKAKIYHFKTELWNQYVTHEFIPCVRKGDCKPGMLDISSVWYQFYTNDGSGEFNYPGTISRDIADNSGYNNNISISDRNFPASSYYHDNKIGNMYIDFPGNGYLKLSKDVLDISSSSFTVSVWARTSSSQTQCLFCDRGGTGLGPALFLLSGNSVRFDTVNTNCSAPFSYGDGEWHLYTCTYDGVNRKIYIDGELKTTYPTTSLGTLGGAMTIGGSYPDANNTTPTGNYLFGCICDWRLYATALSADDVYSLYGTRASIDNKGNMQIHGLREDLNEASRIRIYDTGVVQAEDFVEGSDHVKFIGGYEKLKYIESDGNQYINLDLLATKDTSIDIDFTYLGSDELAWCPLYGERGATADTYFNLFINGTSRKVTPNYSAFDPGASSPITFELGSRHRIRTHAGKLYLDGDLVPELSTTNVLADTTVSFYLFCIGTVNGVDNRGMHARIHSCKIYEKNKLIRDLIPVNSGYYDEDIGLFDRIEGKFYGNSSGVGHFTGDSTSGYSINSRTEIFGNELKEN